MGSEGWVFEEHQRDAVCKGDLCPKCLGKHVKLLGSNCDLRNSNNSYRCEDCLQEWEGY